MYLTPLVFSAALLLEIIGSYMSIVGLSAKSNMFIVLFAVILDFVKIIIATVLYKKWNELGFLIKAFLMPCLFFLIFITSYGSYGYLLREFGKTTIVQETILNKISSLEVESKKLGIRKLEIDNQIAAINPGYVNQKKRLTEMFKEEIDYINVRIKEIDAELPKLNSDIVNDAINSGTLASLSKSWGIKPEQIAKILALMMTMVIDPLAIVLLIVGNFLQMQAVNKRQQQHCENNFIADSGEDKNKESSPINESVIYKEKNSWDKSAPKLKVNDLSKA